MLESKQTAQVARIAAVVLVAVAVLERAWVTEDAYITFRTVDNFVNGYGLTWNIDERVQAYTHPLWMFLHIPFYWLTGEIFLTTLGISLLCSVGAVAVAARSATRAWTPLVLALPLVLSRSFCDYSTSGLENPLTFLCMAWFVTALPTASPRTLTLIAALSAFNRLDTLAFYLPALALVLYQHKSVRTLLDMAVGLLPLALWELFSLVYYGFLFPTTRYGKLSTGVDSDDYFAQGIAYAFDLVARDPASVVALLAGLAAVGVFLADRQDRAALRYVAFGLGVGLYAFYVVKVGGDFMAGRFWSGTVFGAVLLAFIAVDRYVNTAEAQTAVLLSGGLWAVVYPRSTYFKAEPYTSESGIADERAFWAKTNAIENYKRGGSVFEHRQARLGLEAQAAAITAKAAGERYVTVSTTVGMLGFHAGPDVIVIDKGGLAEPLLARLPIENPEKWRPGHFMRYVPRGYEDVRKTGDISKLHPDLQAYYQHLHHVVAGDLFDGERWGDILNFALGRYDAMLEPYIEGRRKANAARPEEEEAEGEIAPAPAAAEPADAPVAAMAVAAPVTGPLPVSQSIPIQQASTPKADHMAWDDPSNFRIPANAELRFVCDPPVTPTTMEISTDAKDVYTVVFYDGEDELGRISLPKVQGRHPGLATRTVELPIGVTGERVTQVGVFGEGDGRYGVGHLILR